MIQNKDQTFKIWTLDTHSNSHIVKEYILNYTFHFLVVRIQKVNKKRGLYLSSPDVNCCLGKDNKDIIGVEWSCFQINLYKQSKELGLTDAQRTGVNRHTASTPNSTVHIHTYAHIPTKIYNLMFDTQSTTEVISGQRASYTNHWNPQEPLKHIP